MWSAVAGIFALLLVAMLSLIGLYEVLASFIVDDGNYARACFGMLNLMTVHLTIIRYEIDKRVRR